MLNNTINSSLIVFLFTNEYADACENYSYLYNIRWKLKYDDIYAQTLYVLVLRARMNSLDAILNVVNENRA